MEELKKHLEAIQKWQDENKDNRAAIVLVAEISNENENGFEQNNLFGLSGKQLTSRPSPERRSLRPENR